MKRSKTKWVLRGSIFVLVLIGIILGITHPLLDSKKTPAPMPASLSTKPTGLPLEKVVVASDAPALGIAAGSSLSSLDSQTLSRRLSDIAASGAKWVRFDFDWSSIQANNSHDYNWSTYDKIVEDANKQHLNVLGILDFTPNWAQAESCKGDKACYPDDPSAYAAFAAAAAERYSPRGVHYWEIWNEPNNPQFWQPSASPSNYTNLLRAAYPAVHKADPNAYVITGGLSPQATTNNSYSPIAFLEGMYNAGAHGYFDAVGDHPYTFPLSPLDSADDAWTQMEAPKNSLRELMINSGDESKKIWITEYGSPTNGPGPIATINNPNLGAKPYVVDQTLQAKLLSDAISEYRTYTWAGPFMYYSFVDSGTSTSTNENFFGLVSADGSLKSAYAVFKQAAANY